MVVVFIGELLSRSSKDFALSTPYSAAKGNTIRFIRRMLVDKYELFIFFKLIIILTSNYRPDELS